jgi:nucleoside-diphosphate-sugar epimerase
MDVVFHTAALATHWSPREAYWRTNGEGLRNLLGAMERAGTERIIHFSTYLVYGRRTGIRTEAEPCERTGDGYIDSKIAAEELIRRDAEERGIVGRSFVRRTFMGRMTATGCRSSRGTLLGGG